MCVCACIQETVKDDLCGLNEEQFQQLADELRDQTLNVSSLSPLPIAHNEYSIAQIHECFCCCRTVLLSL